MYPFIYFQDYKLSVYFLTLAVVYCIGIQYYFVRLKKFPVKSSVAADFLFVLMISGFIGARLFYVIYQEPDFYLKNPKEILSVWNGGFVYYGGFLLGLFSGLVFLKLKKQKLLLWLDISAPVAAFSYGLGRLACLFNGCCYGSETNVVFGLKFPHLHGLRHPTQLYAVFYEFVVWLVLLILERRVSYFKNNLGSLFFTWLCLHGIGRLIMEHFRADPRGDLIFGFTVSSVISLALILIALGCQVPNRGHKASKVNPLK